ncbi:MAG: sulfotransferase family protein [Anaerolineales bacterium]|nr:sulfotransferase family protein [Anaerolineales bacterium]
MNDQSLKVIGAGLGRTGTESLKKALELLGFDACYHMFELTMKHPEHLPEWEKLVAGETPNYEFLFDGYQSTADFPACMFYREFMAQYPQAKVVLTVRDADKWYDSAAKTIFRGVPVPIVALGRLMGLFSKNVRASLLTIPFANDVVNYRFFEGRISDREHTKAIFNAWNEEVKRTVPPERLLVFEVKEGWAPLCHFLGVPIPSTPFPHANKGDTFEKDLLKRIKSDGKR